MDIRTYRAATMHQALALVRRDLGPDAAVLHTREVSRAGLLNWLRGAREIEVTASAEVNVPSRLPKVAQPELACGEPPAACEAAPRSTAMPAGSAPFPEEVKGQLSNLQTMLHDLCRRSQGRQHEMSESLFRLFTDLIEADLSEELAREMVERVRSEAVGEELADSLLIKARIARMIEAEITTTGPISISPGRHRLVALVGPTGVGKTTTIAKLAANYRFKGRHSVGLITVDTYRIGAVDQLRTYADIIDLPMHVVSTPREMREAVRRLNGLDLILMDTAGRSPKDGIKIQELRAFLAEAKADDVYLVLSSVAAQRTLQQAAERFAAVGTTGLILTKLDEATGLGNVLPLLRSSKLPLSYLTNGQSVPDDIEVAEPNRLARMILGVESASKAA